MDRVRGLVKGDELGAVRALAGVLLGVTILVVLYRRTSVLDPWGSLAIFLLLLAPTVFLYAAGVLGGRAEGGAPSGWQVAYTAFGLVLLPLTLFAFLDWVGGDPDSAWNAAWIFGVVAFASFAAALVAGVRVGCLFGALSLLVVWLALWDELLSDGLGADAGTLRGLLLVAALLLLTLAGAIAMRGRPEGGASDVITAAGIAAIAAGALAIADTAQFISPVIPGSESEIGSSTLWELELLVVSIGLVVYGARSATRGPAYVGGFGLFAFVFVVGVDVGNPDRDGSLLGWPLALLIATALLLAASLIPGLRRPPA